MAKSTSWRATAPFFESAASTSSNDFVRSTDTVSTAAGRGAAAASISAFAAASFSLLRAAMTTRAPRAAQSFATSLPIPLEPPVTSTTAPSSLFRAGPYAQL